MKKPRSIEGNLVSLGVVVGLLIGVLLLMLVGVERSLNRNLDQLGSSTIPAQQGIAGLQHAVSLLFERQVQVLSSRTDAELAPLASRAAIERGLTESQRLLFARLPDIVGQTDAAHADALLAQSTREVLADDAALFQRVKTRLAYEAQFEARTASLRTSLEGLTQEARAVAGIAHLDYVLELRRVAAGASPDNAIRGSERAQQEAAQQVVSGVLQLGQLVGKVALARHEDELNSIVANELLQNLARVRTQLSVLAGTLGTQSPSTARVQHMQELFTTLSAELNAAADPRSLVELRRSALGEATQAVKLRQKIQSSVAALSSQLDSVERVVTRETESATRSSRRAAWVARLLSPVALAAALIVAWHSARRLRESVWGLRAQNRELESLSHDLKSMNEGLEGLVAERSAALVARERSMRLVLDAMSEGLIPVDLEGNVAGDCSKVAVSWFGPAEASTPVWRYLLAHDERAEASFQLGFAQLAADLMPFEASADCMPRRFEKDGSVYALGYRQVFEAGVFRRILIVVHDVTHQVVTEARERDARERHQLLAQLLKDKQGFREFVRDSERLLSELHAEPERAHALRTLHTLKGNTAVFGMESVAERCHALEETLAERSHGVTQGEAQELAQLWQSRLARIEEVLTSGSELAIKEEDFAELVQGLRQRRDYAELTALAESFKWIQTSLLLQRFATQAERVAERLEKTVAVRVEHHELRLLPGALEEFWSAFIHAVRNAVDHGIETPDERLALGKSPAGNLLLRTSRAADGGLSVELADDGRGIDFDRLRAVCEERGLPARTRAELIEGMFQNGVTTRNEVTDTSGRGVGLGAIVAACRAAGGKVEVDSGDRKGTRFRFLFPKEAVEVREVTTRALPQKSERKRPSIAAPAS